MSSYHIAIDIGAGSGRAVVGRIEEGGNLSIRELHRFSTRSLTVNGRQLVNIYQIFNEILQALELFAKEYKAPLGSIGIDTWATDFGILDKDGKLIGLPCFYRDKRTEGTSSIVDETVGREQVHLWTGGRFDACSTLHQLVSMKRDEDCALESGSVLLFLGDLLNFFLTGVAKSEYSVASYSQMYNMKEQCWEDRIFNTLGIPEKLQPEVIRSGEIVGELSTEILQQTALTGKPLVIAPAIHDTASAALAVPFGQDCAFISSGTWSLVGMVLDKPIINLDSYNAQLSSTGMGFDKVLFKKNIVGLWIFQECIRNWRKDGIVYSYAEMDRMAEEARPHLAFIDSDDPVFFRPENMVLSIRNYLKETGQAQVATDDVGQIVRIVYESMALKYKQSLDLMESVSSRTFDKISIVGGGSKIELINRFAASVTGLPVYAGPDEASSIGNILMQACGMGELSGEESGRAIVKDSFSIRKYSPVDKEGWSAAYKRYCSFLDLCSREQCSVENVH